MILPGKYKSSWFLMVSLRESSLSSTCTWRFYKQLNSIPENPTFKSFWITCRVLWLAAINKRVEACRKNSSKEKEHRISSNTLNFFPVKVLLFILYRCCFKQMLHLKLSGRMEAAQKVLCHFPCCSKRAKLQEIWQMVQNTLQWNKISMGWNHWKHFFWTLQYLGSGFK